MRALLDLVQEMVSEYALDRILNGAARVGSVDAPTRYYILHRWAYARGKVPFDDAMRLVAQTLINILPGEDPERRLLEGFLAGRDILPETTRQDRLL